MNTATKIFTVLNLLLAVAFCAIAIMWYATGENWKRRWVDDTARLAVQLNDSKDSLAQQSLGRRSAEAALHTSSQQVKALSSENDAQLSRNNQMTQELISKDLVISQQQDQILTSNERIQGLEESLKNSRQRSSELNQIAQVAKAIAFQLNVKLSEVEDDANNLQTQLSKSTEKIHSMEVGGERKDAQLALVKRDYPEVYKFISGESLDSTAGVLTGVVAAVRPDPATGEQHLVMLSIGGDEKVQEGTEFIIYRGNQYVVKVRVQKVFPDMAACLIDPKSWNKQDLKVELADKAQNRLFY